jgi:hypothetical protein
MSQITIRSILETKLATLTPAVSTQYENILFTPVVNVPYQSAYLMMNTPDNPTLGDSFYREMGLFQVTLRYPLGKGTVAAMTQAEKIRDLFKRGTRLTKNNITVLCDKTPDIRVLSQEVDRFVVAVRISFTADILT